MKVAHWTILNGSGMHRVAESLAQAETANGTESLVCDPSNTETWEAGVDADVHVCHTHIPDSMTTRGTKPFKKVWVAHGTPENVIHTAFDAVAKGGYGQADALMLMQYHLRTSDARVTFWDRHAELYRTMVDRSTMVDCVPLGVDKTFWTKQDTQGKYAGSPSVFTAENQHRIKWVLDLLLAWPLVTKQLQDATLHAPYLPHDHHRILFPLANANGAGYKAHLSPVAFDHPTLRNALCSTDFFVGLVRYGDFNRLCLEANATGATTVSYAGNPYSDYWVPEGDQRALASALVDIFTGKTQKREKSPVPDVRDTATAMQAIYERILTTH